MRVVALESYYGGSHQAFLDGWRAHSTLDWELLSLPPYKWKWRMRHSAWHFAQALQQLPLQPDDVLLCSDMLNLAELRGLHPAVTLIPNVLYFHENQLTYPTRKESERDYHFVFSNLLSGCAADEVWFNSAWHRDDFLNALPRFLQRMPDHQPLDAVQQLRERAQVHWPGIPSRPSCEPVDRSGPLHVVWAARWEHDKDPDSFFEALRIVRARGGELRVSVIGQQFRDAPAVFETARSEFADWIVTWGFQPRAVYDRVLAAADLFVSTAQHEFFGLSAAEAIVAGTPPLLPRRLAYPELLQACGLPPDEHLYDGTAAGLAEALLTAKRRRNTPQAGLALTWATRAAALDAGLRAARRRVDCT